MYNLHILNDIYTNGYQLVTLSVISVLSIFCGLSVITAKNPIVSILYLIGLFLGIALYLMSLGMNFIGLSYLLVYVGAVSILFLFILMLINVRISELVTDNSNSLILAILIGSFIITPIYAKGSYHNTNDNIYYDVNKIMIAQNDNLHSAYILPLKKIEDDKFTHAIEQGINDNPWLLFTDFVESVNTVFQNFTYYNGQYTNNIFFVTSKMWDGVLGEMSHITSIGNIIYTSYPLWLIITSIILLLAMVGAIVITIKQE